MSGCGYSPALPGYIGNKWRARKVFWPIIPDDHEIFIETCVGGGSVAGAALMQPYFKKYVLNDANPNIAAVYKTLQDSKAAERVIRRMKDEEQELSPILEQLDDEDEQRAYAKELQERWSPLSFELDTASKDEIEEAAFHTMLRYAGSFNGAGKGMSRNTVYETNFIGKAIHAALEFSGYMQGENILVCNIDLNEIVDRYKDNEKAFIFLDTPYIGMYRGKTDLYYNEFSSLKEHAMICQKVHDAKAAVMMCGYRAPDGLPTLYDHLLGANFACYYLGQYCKLSQYVDKGESKDTAEEYIWTNAVNPLVKYKMDIEDVMDPRKGQLSLETFIREMREAGIGQTVQILKDAKINRNPEWVRKQIEGLEELLRAV